MKSDGKNTQPDISIVIVNYNVKDFLYQCLKSIEVASQGLETEIFVVDNNSTDGSMILLPKHFPTVTFIPLEKNIGFGKANNIAINKAAGKYILLLNPDTLLSENTLREMISYMEKEPKVGIAGCKVLNEDGTFQASCKRGFPTPWASVSKLFYLEKLFPNSPLFAQYSQSFRDENDSYFVDAISGCFMFCRNEVLQQLQGFDPEFHMYGEDIDLCYRANAMQWKTGYFHETTIIHYKGKSTKRSSLNEIRVFYQAMEIFAKKHFGNSHTFLFLLRFGIRVRELLANVVHYKRSFGAILWDALSINAALLVATPYRFDSMLGFPEQAYPMVFIVLTIVLCFSQFFSGAYFEGKSYIRKTVVGYAVSFFILSSLTYFFNEYAFSRGVLLLTIVFGSLLSVIGRSFVAFYDKVRGAESEKRIGIIGNGHHAVKIIDALLGMESQRAHIVGMITVGQYGEDTFEGIPILGELDYVQKIIEENDLNEVIVTDNAIDKTTIMQLAIQLSVMNIRLHAADDYDDIITSRIVNSISGMEPTVPVFKASLLRNRVLKRLFDLVFSIFLLTLGSPIVFLFAINKKNALHKLWDVVRGNKSLVGIYSTKGNDPPFIKIGIAGLAHLSRPQLLSNHALENLNDYYIRNYSLSLDLEILLRYFFRRKRGK